MYFSGRGGRGGYGGGRGHQDYGPPEEVTGMSFDIFFGRGGKVYCHSVDVDVSIPVVVDFHFRMKYTEPEIIYFVNKVLFKNRYHVHPIVLGI